MGLVYRDKTHLHVGQLEAKELRVDAFGRKIEEFVLTEDDVVELTVDFFAGESRVDGRGLDVSAPQVLDLVFHQGDERRDDQTSALHHEGRHLEGDAFSSAGGHQPECVVAGEQTVYDFALNAAKVVVAPSGFQHGAWIVAVEGRLRRSLHRGQPHGVGRKIGGRPERFAPEGLQLAVDGIEFGVGGRKGIEGATHRVGCLRFVIAPRRVCVYFPPRHSKCRTRGAF